MSFETIIRAAAERGLIPEAEGHIDAWVAERMARHRNPGGTIVHRQGSGRWFRINEHKIEGGGTVAVYTDITEYKQAVEALQESEGRFSSLVSNIAGAVYRCACDKDWTMEFMSEAIQGICGYPVSDFLENRVRSYASVIHLDDLAMVEDTVLQAVDRKQPFTIRYRIHNAKGEVRWVWERGNSVFDDWGRLR